MTGRVLVSSWPDVAVAGGSIGGLTTAILLRDLGCEVDVYERSAAPLADRGAGIVVLPVTERLLELHGRNDDVMSLTWWKYVDASGEVLSADPDNFRFTSWTTIYQGLLGIFGDDHYHLGSELVDITPEPGSVEAALSGDRKVSADLLVCADGIQSTARNLLLPEVSPNYAGYVAWRGVTSEAVLSEEARRDLADSLIYQILDHSHILVYAIPGPNGSTSVGERSINFVWYRNYPEGESFDDIMTDVDGVRRPTTMPPGSIRQEHMERMRDTASRALAPTLAEVVLKADTTLIQAIFDLESDRMVFDRACLLGDAAFAVRPHVAAGQAKACADGWALADALQRAGGDVVAALGLWEQPQLELGRAVVGRSRDMGERVQIRGELIAGDPTWKFGLYGPHD
ncbi:MAG: monooxygenase [Acidimicrobiia bacterium]|nr:monooxygenase [Acidimicrobiia bacterium]